MFHRYLAVVFTLLLSGVAAADAASISFSFYGLNFNKAEAEVKARFLCYFDGNGKYRLAAIDKKIDSMRALQSELAFYHPDEAPEGFRIQYELPSDVASRRFYRINVDTDDDVRNLMAVYDAYAKASSDPVRIRLYLEAVKTSSPELLLCLRILFHILTAIGGLCCSILVAMGCMAIFQSYQEKRSGRRKCS